MREISLFEHNKDTYNNVLKSIENGDNKIGIVQPTGTGKSYIIVKLLQDYFGQRKILISPSYHIFTQISHICKKTLDDTIFMTYAKLSNLEPDDMARLSPKLIIIDEFHRSGAETWNEYVEQLIKMNPQAIIVGTSATPIRYLDGARDMGDELFENNLAINMTLVEAIVKGLLPMPKYISALYSFDDTISKLVLKVRNSKNSEKEKLAVLKQIEKAKHHLEKSNGIPTILKKHFNVNAPKTIVFCKNIDHLKEMMPIVTDWFHQAFNQIEVNSFVIQSENGNIKNANIIKEFKKASTGIQLLFTVDILNEGIHIDGVLQLILLRPTISPTIFYQQIGRAISSGNTVSPVVFDFVNNVENISAKYFKEDLLVAYETVNKCSGEYNMPEFEIYDEILDIKNEFLKIESKLLFSWDIYYEALIKFKETFKNTDVPSRYKEPLNNLYLGKWLCIQRKKYREGNLSTDEIKKLESLDFDFNKKYFDDHWMEMFEELSDFKEKQGHLLVPRKIEYKSLSNWCVMQRNSYRNNCLSDERKDKLIKLGFSFDYQELRINELLNLYLDAINNGINISSNNPFYKSKNMYKWIIKVRELNEQNLLPDEVFNALEKVDFPWNKSYSAWEESYNILVDWLKSNNIVDLERTLIYKNYSLGVWVDIQKSHYRNNKLEKNRFALLDKLGLNWNKALDDNWQSQLDLYKKYLEKENNFTAKEIIQAKNWEQKQRSNKRKNKISQEHINILNDIGFKWEVSDNLTWDESYEVMIDFKSEFGNCDTVANQIYHNYNLGGWVISQRKLFNKNKLLEEQISRLNDIGFIWDKRMYDWETAYKKMKLYYIKYGHSDAKRGEKIDEFPVGDWARSQRNRFAGKRISRKEILLLNKLRFSWN